VTEFGRLGMWGLAFYLLGLIVLAFVARRARDSDSPADHFLAGRGLGVFVLFLTLYATAYSGNSLLGYPGEAYRRGFSWIMATGFMLSIIVAFHALVPKLRPIAVRHHFVTPGDWVRYRFRGEPGCRVLLFCVSSLMTIALANFLFAQLKAMGELSTEVTGGVISYEMGIALLAGMILFYETLGGMRAVAWTDAAQGILMMLGLSALAAWLLGEARGLEAMSQQILAVRPEIGRVPDTAERMNWLSSIVLLGLASVVYPQAIQRIYAARDGRALKRSFALMSFMPLATTLVVTLIGLAAIPRFVDLGEVAADRVMPLLLGQWASAGPVQAGAAVMVFLGALAAIMSTADSCLLSLGSSLAEDLFGRSRDAASTTAFAKRAAGAVMIGMAVVAMVARDVTLWGLIELKMELLIQCVPAFLVAIRWRGFRATPAWIGLVVGSAIAIVGAIVGVKRIEGLHVGIIGLVCNLAIAYLGSLMLGPAIVRSPDDGGTR
jgi:Na+/proline symporter